MIREIHILAVAILIFSSVSFFGLSSTLSFAYVGLIIKNPGRISSLYITTQVESITVEL